MKYPPLARQARIQGVVEVQCIVDGTGRVTEVQPVSGHPLLTATVIDNVKKWEFQNAQDKETPSNEIRLVYSFELIGDAGRHDGMPEFSFEYPNRVRLRAHPACMDHAPCTDEEVRQWNQEVNKNKHKKSPLRAIP